MERKDLMIDLDDTLNRMQQAILAFINSASPIKVRFSEWNSTAREGGKPEVEGLLREFLQRPDLVIKTPPFKKALAGVQLLHQQGFHLHIVSARKEPLHQTTQDWLEKHGFSPLITAVHHRPTDLFGPKFKLEVAKKINAQAAFDDTKDIAQILAADGIPVYLIRRPWNKELSPSDLIIPRRSFYQAVRTFLLRNHGSSQT